MKTVLDRFLDYISIDTTSVENSATYPSSENQWVLAEKLAEELRTIGLSEVEVDEHGYVTASIPANVNEAPVLGLIAHMDTSNAVPGGPICPKAVPYKGGDIILNSESDIRLTPTECPELKNYVGQTLIVTDGTTLLGADDKAGIAEIITAAEYLIQNPSIPHGKIRIGFTPDEEVSAGTRFFDVKKFGADVAYTVDGGPLGELEYENFNAATATIKIHGKSYHPGSSKGRMVNALVLSGELQGMVPFQEQPAFTEGYEGFYHLTSVNGTVSECTMKYIIRQHDRGLFLAKKQRMEKIVSYMNDKYGAGTIELLIEDKYFNMKEIIEQHLYLIDKAKAAFAACEVSPLTVPIRGGTDGARLSFKGLPCPNLSTGGHNFHGIYEFIPLESMERMVDVLVALVQQFTV